MSGRIIEQNLISSQYDFVKLDIIDWNRLNGTSETPADAMRDISSWFIGRACYTIVEHDLRHAPIRNDFPQWQHVGRRHAALARLFWNDFLHHYPKSDLHFADEPDFSGTLECRDGTRASFWGDIGKVSASAFGLTTIRQMQEHTLWISVLDERRQVIIETIADLQSLFEKGMIIHD